MVQTVEAILQTDGSVRLLEPIQTTSPRRALVLVLQESPEAMHSETAILSESALTVDGNRAA